MVAQIRPEGGTDFIKLQQLLPQLKGPTAAGGGSAAAGPQRQQGGPRVSAFSRLGLPVDGNAPERKRSERVSSVAAPQRQEPVGAHSTAPDADFLTKFPCHMLSRINSNTVRAE